MKWKMAENSLFAILLRAPWYASGSIALVIIALSFALLPTEWVIFGVAAALPFIVIFGMVVWRMAGKPSAATVEATEARVRALNVRAFGTELTESYESTGHQVEAAQQTGADLVVTLGWRVKVLAYRKWKAAHVGVDPLRALAGARDAAEAQSAAFVTLGQLSEAAVRYAEKERIEIIGAEALTAMLGKSGKSGK